jgi:hypothetical protein
MPASPLYAGTAIVRNDLGAVAYEFMSGADQLGYIGGVVLPIFDVPLGVGQYPVVPLEALFTEVDDARGPTGDYNEVDWPFEMADYRCADRGLLGRVDDGLRNLYANVIQVEEITTRTVMARIMRLGKYSDRGRHLGYTVTQDETKGLGKQWTGATSRARRAGTRHSCRGALRTLWVRTIRCGRSTPTSTPWTWRRSGS